MQFPNTLAAGISVVCAAVLISCSPKQGDIVVAKIGNRPVPLSEYENLYLKSAGTREQAAGATQEERERFLDLMTKFKLKLGDAYDQGLDKRAEIKNEIAQYKGSLVASFLTEREVNAPGIRKMFDGRQQEVRASHILLQLAPNAPAEDSARAYKTAYELIAALKAGARFDSLALAHSTDPSVSQNKGDLYYFTSGQMVPEFEEAAFATKPGETTSARTQYGLHIIKVVAKKPVQGEIKASHIMIRFDKQDPTPDDTLAAHKKIQLIQDSVKIGTDFGELAMRNSGDPGSAPRGGDLDWFGRRRWIQPFDEEAFKLKPGQVSGVVRTIYGYHLIKCYETKPPKTFEEAKKEIQQTFQQTRFPSDYANFLNRLKNRLQYSVDAKTLDAFAVAFDSTKTTRDSAWFASVTPALAKKALFTFGQRTISVDSTIGIITSRPDMASMPLTSASVRQNVEKIGEQLVFQVRGETIEKDYPEFSPIMKEYMDGILLYQIEQERVWGRVAVNDTVLQKYFEANRDKFMFPDRVDFSSASFITDSVAQLVRRGIMNGTSLEQVFAEDSTRMKIPISFQTSFAKNSSTLSADAMKAASAIAGQMKSDATLRVQVTVRKDTSTKASERLAKQRIDAVKSYVKKRGIAESRVSSYEQIAPDQKKAEKEKSLNSLRLEIIGKRSWFVGRVESLLQPVPTDERSAKADSLAAGAYTEPFNYSGSFTIVRLNKKDPLRRKTYTEAGTEVSSAFQEYESKRLENEWLAGLRAKNPVVEYKEVLKSAFAPTK